MKAKIISKLTRYEDLVIESIAEFAKEDRFYSLPTSEMLEIIKRSNIEDVELLCDIISKMSENKENDAVLLLNVINPKNVTLK